MKPIIDYANLPLAAFVEDFSLIRGMQETLKTSTSDRYVKELEADVATWRRRAEREVERVTELDQLVREADKSLAHWQNITAHGECTFQNHGRIIANAREALAKAKVTA